MRRNIYIFLFLTLNWFYCSAQTITWADDIACITYTHCANCHNNQNSLVAFPLTSYNEANAQRNAIKYYTGYMSMPPYQPNTKHRRYAMEKTLTQTEIDLIAAWVDGGCIRGDSTHEPPSPVINPTKSTIASPDFSIKMPDYIIPNNGINFRRCFILSSPLIAAKQIKEIEVVPGNLSAIYAVYVYSDTSSAPLALDIADTGYGYMNFGGTGSNFAKPLYGWVHGQDPLILPNNCVLKIDSGSRYIIQIEYAEDAGGKLDSTRLNIKYASSSGSRDLLIASLLNHSKNLLNGPLIILPDSIKEFHEKYILTSDVTLFSVSPIMHHICTGFELYAVQPGNDTILLLTEENHGEIWSEGTYYFQSPIHLKNGSFLEAFAHYDNTLSNGNNPNNPPQSVNAGFGTDDEQMIFNFSFTPYLPGDENMIMDSFPHQTHYKNCSTVHNSTGIGNSSPLENSFIVYPNPSSSILYIETSNGLIIEEINLLNVLGETVIRQNISNSYSSSIDISSLVNGIYYLKLLAKNKLLTTKIIKSCTN